MTCIRIYQDNAQNLEYRGVEAREIKLVCIDTDTETHTYVPMATTTSIDTRQDETSIQSYKRTRCGRKLARTTRLTCLSSSSILAIAAV